MAIIDTISNGDSGLEARTIINNNDALINAELGELKNKTKSGTETLLAGTRTITFASDFTDADYNVIYLAVSSSGIISFPTFVSPQTKSGFTIILDFDSQVIWIAHKN